MVLIHSTLTKGAELMFLTIVGVEAAGQLVVRSNLARKINKSEMYMRERIVPTGKYHKVRMAVTRLAFQAHC